MLIPDNLTLIETGMVEIDKEFFPILGISLLPIDSELLPYLGFTWEFIEFDQ